MIFALQLLMAGTVSASGAYMGLGIGGMSAHLEMKKLEHDKKEKTDLSKQKKEDQNAAAEALISRIIDRISDLDNFKKITDSAEIEKLKDKTKDKVYVENNQLIINMVSQNSKKLDVAILDILGQVGRLNDVKIVVFHEGDATEVQRSIKISNTVRDDIKKGILDKSLLKKEKTEGMLFHEEIARYSALNGFVSLHGGYAGKLGESFGWAIQGEGFWVFGEKLKHSWKSDLSNDSSEDIHLRFGANIIGQIRYFIDRYYIAGDFGINIQETRFPNSMVINSGTNPKKDGDRKNIWFVNPIVGLSGGMEMTENIVLTLFVRGVIPVGQSPSVLQKEVKLYGVQGGLGVSYYFM